MFDFLKRLFRKEPNIDEVLEINGFDKSRLINIYSGFIIIVNDSNRSVLQKVEENVQGLNAVNGPSHADGEEVLKFIGNSYAVLTGLSKLSKLLGKNYEISIEGQYGNQEVTIEEAIDYIITQCKENEGNTSR